VNNVEGYGSLDELFDRIAAMEDHANAHLADAQRRLDWGSRFIVFTENQNDPLVIFGYCQTEAEVAGEERAAMIAEGDDPDRDGAAEHQAIMARLVTAHDRGYLYGPHYSVAVPDGELGSTHRAGAWPINAALFEQAGACRWDIRAMDDALRDGIGQLYERLRHHLLSTRND